MTSTSTQVGLNPDSRNSSRVLNPPGGKGSINLFGGGDPTPDKSQSARSNPKNSTSKDNFFDQPGSSTKPITPPKAAPRRSDPIRPQQPEPKPAPIRHYRNPVTGEGVGYVEPKACKPRDVNNPIVGQTAPPVTGGRPSTKVHAPPGGHSQITFG